MEHLLNLLAAIALLVWGTQIVRTGVLGVFGENLRHILAASTGSRPAALLAGAGVTSLIQSSTATCLITASLTVDSQNTARMLLARTKSMVDCSCLEVPCCSAFTGQMNFSLIPVSRVR